MPKSVDRIPPMPRIQALDPKSSEQSWESASQLLAALNGARLGAWYWDIERGQISWSRGTQALFGFDPRQPLPADLEYLDLLPVEDRAKTLRAFHAVIGGAPLEQAMRSLARRQPALAGDQRQPAAGQARPSTDDWRDPRNHPPTPARTGAE